MTNGVYEEKQSIIVPNSLTAPSSISLTWEGPVFRASYNDLNIEYVDIHDIAGTNIFLLVNGNVVSRFSARILQPDGESLAPADLGLSFGSFSAIPPGYNVFSCSLDFEGLDDVAVPTSLTTNDDGSFGDVVDLESLAGATPPPDMTPAWVYDGVFGPVLPATPSGLEHQCIGIPLPDEELVSCTVTCKIQVGQPCMFGFGDYYNYSVGIAYDPTYGEMVGFLSSDGPVGVGTMTPIGQPANLELGATPPEFFFLSIQRTVDGELTASVDGTTVLTATEPAQATPFGEYALVVPLSPSVMNVGVDVAIPTGAVGDFDLSLENCLSLELLPILRVPSGIMASPSLSPALYDVLHDTSVNWVVIDSDDPVEFQTMIQVLDFNLVFSALPTHLQARGEGFDVDYGGFVVDSRDMDSFEDFVSSFVGATPLPFASEHGLAISGFLNVGEWTALLDYLDDLFGDRVVPLTVANFWMDDAATPNVVSEEDFYSLYEELYQRLGSFDYLFIPPSLDGTNLILFSGGDDLQTGYNWQFEGSLIPRKAVSNVRLFFTHFSDELGFATVSVTGDNSGYERIGSVNKVGKILTLGDLEDDTYTITIRGLGTSGSYGMLGFRVSGRGMEPMSVLDSGLIR